MPQSRPLTGPRSDERMSCFADLLTQLFEREQSFLAFVRRETTLADFAAHPARLVATSEREHELGVLPRGHLKRDDLDSNLLEFRLLCFGKELREKLITPLDAIRVLTVHQVAETIGRLEARIERALANVALSADDALDLREVGLFQHQRAASPLGRFHARRFELRDENCRQVGLMILGDETSLRKTACFQNIERSFGFHGILLSSGVFVYSILATHYVPFSRYTMRCYRVKASISAVKELNNPYWITGTNIAYMRLKVKRNRKSPYFRAFSRFLYWIKKFSFPRIKIWFAPMFFSGLLCGFERFGSAVFRIFRGGFSPPAAAKWVRTNSRIEHHLGNCKFKIAASLRSAVKTYCILGSKMNWRFCIRGKENFLILNF